MRKHWQLVHCAFSFCCYHASHVTTSTAHEPVEAAEPSGVPESDVTAYRAGTVEKNRCGTRDATAGVLASRAAGSMRVAGAVDYAEALLDRLVTTAPISSGAIPVQLA